MFCARSVLFASLVWAAFALAAALPSRASKDMQLPTESVDQKELNSIYRDLKIIEKLENITDSRDSRGLLKKISFLTGIKLGGILQSSGTLAASNSIRLFGKVLNAALSVSYGTHQGIVDPVPEIDNSSEQNDSDEDKNKVKLGEPNELEEEYNRLLTSTTRNPLPLIRKQFLQDHNLQVERLNQRFLKLSHRRSR